MVDDSGKPEHQRASRAVAERFGARWLCHEVNRGISAGWNTLARASASPLIALLNDDIIVSKGWVEALAFFLEQNPHAGTCGLHFNFLVPDDVSVLVADPDAPPPARDPFSKAPKADDHDPYSEPGLMMCPPGCCFGFTREKFDLVGGFDENFKSFYEESDFGTALASRGFPSYVTPWPTLGHIWSATFAQAPELAPSDRMTESRVRYIEKWGGHFEQTNPRFMSRIEPRLTRWLTPGGPREALR